MMVIRKRAQGYIYYNKKRDKYIVKFPLDIDINTGIIKFKTKFCKNKKDAELLIKNRRI